MWDGLDQRKFPRINLRCQIIVKQKQTQKEITATTENLGIGGLCLIQPEPLERFSHCQLKIELVKNQPNIECEGKITWIIPNQGGKSAKKLFDTGIEFLNLSESDKQRLKQYLEDKVNRGFKQIT